MSDTQNASSNTQLSLMGPGRPGSSTQTNSGRLFVSEQELVEKCLSTVEDYKNAIISKQEAFFIITKTIASATYKATD
jgi:hypothetical protein